MKKVGILSLYKNSKNYGGLLQAYALQKIIEEIAGDCEQISYYLSPTPITQKIRNSFQYRSLMENLYLFINALIRKVININKNKNIIDICKPRCKAMHEFELIIPHSYRIYNYKNISTYSEQYTHIVTGSDQIWNGGIDLPAFCLCFAKPYVKRISYAASSGSSRFGSWQKKIFADNLTKFVGVSVREKSVIPYFEKLIDKKVNYMIDPVFLLTANQWREIEKKPQISEPYMISYLLGYNAKHRLWAEKIAHRNGCKLVCLPYMDITYHRCDAKYGDIRNFSAGPCEFLGLIDGAQGVITDSFHALAFSMIFEKKFWALPRFKNVSKNNRNHRISDVLNECGFGNRFCCDDYMNKPLDYTNVRLYISARAEQARTFLQGVLDSEV